MLYYVYSNVDENMMNLRQLHIKRALCSKLKWPTSPCQLRWKISTIIRPIKTDVFPKSHEKLSNKKSQLIETTFDLWHFFLWNVFTEHCSGFIIKWRIRGAYQCPQMSFPKWIGETLVKIANISEANFPKHLLASHQFHFPRTSPLGKSTRV